MSKICQTYAKRMPKICQKYAQEEQVVEQQMQSPFEEQRCFTPKKIPRLLTLQRSQQHHMSAILGIAI